MQSLAPTCCPLDAPESLGRSWLARAVQLETFTDEHGTTPRARGAAGVEAELGAWLTTQRYSHRNARLTPARAAWLDAHVPGWSTSKMPAASRRVHVAQVVAFVDEHGHHPRPNAADPDERRLGTWLSERRRSHRAGVLRAQVAAELDAALPGWSSTSFPTQQHRANAALAVAYHAQTGHWPAATKGSTHARLGWWMQTARRKARTGGLDPQVQATLDRVDPQWRGTGHVGRPARDR